ncbi:MAG: hypothetical protein PHG95_00040 [Patescibacteria group bacterium]|nr:hypothetical protein [Patescibacteria group bacterium]
MLKKNFAILSSLFFWLAPLLFYFGWRIAVIYPRSLWIVVIAACIILIPAVYEAVGRRFSWLAAAIFVNLAVLIASFYLFISLIASPWVLSLLWLIMLWHLYRYLLFAKRSLTANQDNHFIPIAFASSLAASFFAAASLFGLQSFLSLSPWPLLAALLVLLAINTQALAIIQGWQHRRYRIIWPFIALFTVEITMMLSLLPLNYLISGILSALAYYSAVNFTRLYLENNLKRHKIRNYAWFTAISLAIILLSARWL